MGYERKATRFPVKFGSTFAGEQLAGQGTITNLSAGGCSIESTITLTVQSMVGLHIHIPAAPLPLQIEHATVRWAWGNLFGLQFERMAQSEIDRLQHILHNLEYGSASGQPALTPPPPITDAQTEQDPTPPQPHSENHSSS